MGLVFFTSDTYFRSTSIFFVHVCLLTMPSNGAQLFHRLSLFILVLLIFFLLFPFHGLGAIGSFSLGLGLILLSILYNRVHAHIHMRITGVRVYSTGIVYCLFTRLLVFQHRRFFRLLCHCHLCLQEQQPGVIEAGLFFLERISFHFVFGFSPLVLYKCPCLITCLLFSFQRFCFVAYKVVV